MPWYINPNRKDVRNFKSRMKYILKTFGDHVADEMKPSDIDTWIGAQKWSAATKNPSKNVFGKIFKIALADGKVTGNPARLVKQRPENNTRIRYLLDDEEKSLHKAITRRCPMHLEEFDWLANVAAVTLEQSSLAPL